jgi:alpha-ribazole phosphatase
VGALVSAFAEEAGNWWAWRHPRAQGAEGRCIGHTDLALDPRKARRLARRIRRESVRHGISKVVCTSDLRRCRDVGRLLRRWGWRHVVMPELREADFGDWDGRLWASIGQASVEAWCMDFADHAPGGGESLRQVLTRAAAWVPPASAGALVAHGGWMLARRWVARHGPGQCPASAAQWPAPPCHGQCWRL